ncbi:hypothetical protein HN873_047413, partial [Arachis hypogaea]
MAALENVGDDNDSTGSGGGTVLLAASTSLARLCFAPLPLTLFLFCIIIFFFHCCMCNDSSSTTTLQTLKPILPNKSPGPGPSHPSTATIPAFPEQSDVKGCPL